MAGQWQCLLRQGADQVKMRHSDLLWEGEMRDRKPAVWRQHEERGSADTCQANPSPGSGNPHSSSLPWSRWEVSVGWAQGGSTGAGVSGHTRM